MQRVLNDDKSGLGATPARSPAQAVLRPLANAWNARGLPAKLLILTAAFVLVAEALIFLPSVANFRVSWLQQRLTAAQLAALAAESFPGGQVPPALRADLLRTAQVKAIASKRDGIRRLIMPGDSNLTIDYVYFVRPDPDGFWESAELKIAQIKDALETLLSPAGRTVRVTALTGETKADFIEIVLPDAPLKAAMVRYGLNILWLSVILSALTAAVVYFALSRLFVNPLSRLSGNMLRFSENPEDPERIMPVSGRRDEIGIAERELARMQKELANTLGQKNRLAQLGLAVSKINHDLRNMLANAQLTSDRLVAIPDPTVQRFVPKLIASLDRAISFCNSSLQYGAVAEPAPRRELLLLKPLVEDVADSQGLVPGHEIAFANTMDDALRVDADKDQLFRVLSNLMRNAMQALEGTEAKGGGRIEVAAHRDGRKVLIDVSDNGPGLPAKARENLFKAFQASTKKGGSGLGLVIASELIQAHGGHLRLIDSVAGAHFRIELPDRSTH